MVVSHQCSRKPGKIVVCSVEKLKNDRGRVREEGASLEREPGRIRFRQYDQLSSTLQVGVDGGEARP